MGGITRKSLESPDSAMDFGAHGSAAGVGVEELEVWRSTLRRGWSWDEDIRPNSGGLTSCPMYHHEYVVAGSIRYLMDDGTETIGRVGDYLFISPGHRAWVEAPEGCVLLDW